MNKIIRIDFDIKFNSNFREKLIENLEELLSKLNTSLEQSNDFSLIGEGDVQGYWNSIEDYLKGTEFMLNDDSFEE